MWVRGTALTSNRIENEEVWMMDLLAPLHTEEALIKVGGQYDSAPSGVGYTAVRIHLQIVAIWHRQDLGQIARDDGAFVGIKRDTWSYNSDSVKVTTPDPAQSTQTFFEHDPYEGANTEDWMFWDNLIAYDDKYADDTSEIAGTGSDLVYVRQYDIKSRRALRDLGDTLIFCLRPTGARASTQGVEFVQITSSTLLQKR